MKRIIIVIYLSFITRILLFADTPQITFKAADITAMGSDIEKTVSVEMDNNIPVVSFCCDIALPDGIIVKSNSVTLSNRKNTGHTLMLNSKVNALSVLNVSNQNKTFKNSSGELFSFPITLACEVGTYKIILCNIYVTTGDVASGYIEHHIDDVIINVSVQDPNLPKCNAPVINLEDGTISITCSTPNSVCHYQILAASDNTDQTIGNKVVFVPVIKAYATSEGYLDSDTVTEDLKVCQGIIGDMNIDGKLSIADVTSLIDVIVNQ